MIDLSGLFKAKTTPISAAGPEVSGQDTSDEHHPARVSITGLISLQQAAATLPLKSRFIRTRQGGAYVSAFKGRGMEFDEARPYQAGDEVRHLDWRVTARTGKPYTKMFREERERPVFLWVDYRETMFFATRGAFKAVRAAQIAALLGWGAHHHGDRVGSIIFSRQSHRELQPLRGKAGVFHLIKQLVEHPAWIEDKTSKVREDAALRAMKRLQRVVRPGSLIFLLSDFRHLVDSAEPLFMQLSRHSDIVMICIHDPLEHHLPPNGLYRFSNGQEELTLDTGNLGFRETYQRRFENHQQSLEVLARQLGLRLLFCSTAQDPLKVLQQGLGIAPQAKIRP